jgi:PAS domain S-box-containing protein
MMPQILLHAAMVRWLNELATVGIYTTDEDLVVRSWNQWLERVTGRLEHTVVGQRLFDVFPELKDRQLERYYDAALRGEVSVLAHRFHGYFLKVTTPTGDMPQSARIAPLAQGDRIIGTVTVIEDVSERVNSESELRRQIAAAEEARAVAEEALRVKDEFLATLSHELRTPLNAVLGWTKILLGHSVEPQVVERALNVIDRNASAQARLIDDMLDMARIVSGKLRLEMGSVDLVAATMAAIDVITPSANAKNITINRHLGGRKQIITADVDRLQQIAWNLLANSVKFTPSGGTINVRIESNGDAVSLVVSDTGKGIAADFLPHVFERFRQANSSVSRTEGGLGLGLALVRQLVEMHGGQIAVASPGIDRGATFTITFPLAAVAAATAPGDRVAVESSAIGAYRVLLVDHDRDWRELLEPALVARGATVTTAATARQAYGIVIGEAAGRPDVIVADVALPGEDGYALIKRIRQLPGSASRMPAVAVTAYAGSNNEKRALEAGFDVFRVKPITPDEVVVAVGAALKIRPTPRRLRRA